MNTESMTLTAALSTIKLLDKKIEDTLSGAEFIGVRTAQQSTLKNGVAVSAFEKRAHSSYESLTDLIKRRTAIKSALILANATTRVKIADVDYTIAEAIDFKLSIQSRRSILTRMVNQLAQAKRQVETENNAVQKQLDKNLELMYGKEGDKTSTEAKSMMENYRTLNNSTLVDPLSLEDKIKKMREEIDEFEAQVDIQLSVVNATTSITVSY